MASISIHARRSWHLHSLRRISTSASTTSECDGGITTLDDPSTQLQFWKCHHLHPPLLRKDGKLATLAIKVVAAAAVVTVVVAGGIIIPAALAEIEAQMLQVTIEGGICFVYPTGMALLLLLQQQLLVVEGGHHHHLLLQRHPLPVVK